MRKFNMIQKSCGYKAVYLQITDLMGKEKADEIFDEALQIYEKYKKEYPECKGIKKLHIFSAITMGALYIPLKNATDSKTACQMLEEGAKPVAIAKHNKIEKFPARLFMKIAYSITSTMFGKKAGFERKWHCNKAKEIRFDLLTCPYVDVLKKMECAEVCPVICIQDDYSFSNMKNGVLFERKKTLGRNDDCCDFCYRIPEKIK